jgi:hypothetical protein
VRSIQARRADAHSSSRHPEQHELHVGAERVPGGLCRIPDETGFARGQDDFAALRPRQVLGDLAVLGVVLTGGQGIVCQLIEKPYDRVAPTNTEER